MTKDELLDAVWDDVMVGEGSLSQTVRELRLALGDDAREPRFIETVHRRGFRFIAPVREEPVSSAAPESVFSSPVGGRGDHLFGRRRELDRLGVHLNAALAGSRRLVFVTGDPGIGKTSLIRTFLEQRVMHEVSDSVIVGGGHCVQLYGEGEAYLPVLDAIERLLSNARGESLRRTLKKFAPSWYGQFPWLEADHGSGDTAPGGGTSVRMLREFNVAIEALTAERLLVLWFEDLHWSDPATIDLLGALALRSEPARLLVLATYRPVDAALSDHPVASMKRRLVRQGVCHELALEMLDEVAMREYLFDRFEGVDLDSGMASAFHDVTDGNPLFAVTLADHMVAEGWMAREGDRWSIKGAVDAIRRMPLQSFRDIVEAQLDGLSREEIEILEAASVAGESFSAQNLAAALDTEIDTVELVCGRLSGWGRFLENAGSISWPDGSEGQRFQFIHQTFRAIVYHRLTAGRRRSFHERIAKRMETGYEGDPGAVAAELALHYERGGNAGRAAHFLSLAAQGVKRRFADHEAVAYLDRALELLSSLPETAERAAAELELRIHRARALLVAAPYTGCEQFDNATRMRELSKQLGSPDTELLSLGYQSNLTTIRGDVTAARALVEEAKIVAGEVSNPGLLAHPPVVSGMVALLEGDLATTEREFAEVRSLTDDHVIDAETVVRQGNPGLLAVAFSSWSGWLRGFPDLARQRAKAARARAEALGDPLGMMATLDITLAVKRFGCDVDAARSLFEVLISKVDDLGIVYPYTPLSATEGWLLIQDGELDAAVDRLHRGIETARNEHALYGFSILLGTLAEAELARRSPAHGLEVIDDAMAYVDNSGERLWEAELHRLRGELLRIDGDDDSAETSFHKSLEVAHHQGALSLELRAATSLARILRDTDRTTQAQATLSGLYDQFTEGFDTADLKDAKALLESL